MLQPYGRLSECYNSRQWRGITGLKLSSDTRQNKEVLKMAEVIRSKREIAIAAGLAEISSPEKTKQSLYDYIDSFTTKKQDRKALPYIEKHGGRSIKLTSVNALWFETFQEKMHNDPVLRSTYTQDKYCSVIRRALKRAVSENLIKHSPVQNVRHIKVMDAKRAFLTTDEIKSLENTTCPGLYGKEIYCAFLLGCFIGFRVSVLKSLQWNEIDTKTMQICNRMQKIKEYVYIPITEKTRKIIDTIRNKDETFVFCGLSKLNDISTTNRDILKWAKSAGIKKTRNMAYSTTYKRNTTTRSWS